MVICRNWHRAEYAGPTVFSFRIRFIRFTMFARYELSSPVGADPRKNNGTKRYYTKEWN